MAKMYSRSCINTSRMLQSMESRIHWGEMPLRTNFLHRLFEQWVDHQTLAKSSSLSSHVECMFCSNIRYRIRNQTIISISRSISHWLAGFHPPPTYVYIYICPLTVIPLTTNTLWRCPENTLCNQQSVRRRSASVLNVHENYLRWAQGFHYRTRYGILQQIKYAWPIFPWRNSSEVLITCEKETVGYIDANDCEGKKY